jgi:hypothetical protein
LQRLWLFAVSGLNILSRRCYQQSCSCSAFEQVVGKKSRPPHFDVQSHRCAILAKKSMNEGRTSINSKDSVCVMLLTSSVGYLSFM